MKAKLLIALVTTLFFLSQVQAQIKGNASYKSGNVNFGDNFYQINRGSTIKTTTSSRDEMVVVIKGIYNEKASSFIATFGILQSGKTAEETTNLIDERIQNVMKDLSSFNKEIEIATDMISFVPSYNYAVEKKIFNPKTYNEKPAGFELKKNLIIKYKKGSDFDKIMSVCSKNEIYDLVKVDYITTNYDAIKSQMQKKALEVFKETAANYSLLMNTDLNKKEKTLQEGFNISYPTENYRQYQAYATTHPNFESSSEVNDIKKNTTQYFNGALLREHNFIFNPEITEPSIQAFYEITITIKLKEDQLPKNTIVKDNKYYVITATGEIKRLVL